MRNQKHGTNELVYNTDTDSQREEDHVIIEALIGVLPLQAKEYPELLVTVRR